MDASAISKRVQWLVCFLHFNEAVSMYLIIPLLAPMVEHFLTSSDGADFMAAHKGLYMGYLASAYFWSCTVSGLIWGLIADRYGRRPAILGGLLLCTLSNILLVFSASFPVALVARAVSGFNANLAMNKALVGDCTCAKTQTKAFTYAQRMLTNHIECFAFDFD